MAFNIPQLRLDKATPYDGTYTQQQLDMRRKAEILQYSASASSTKTNNLTRKEKWAQLVRGRGQTETYEDKRYTIIDSSGTYINLVIKYPKYIVLQPSTQYLNGTGTNIVNTAAYRIVGYTGYYTYTIADGALKSCAADNLIPTPTSASGIPGPIQYLIYDTNIPLYNYAINNNALGTSNTGNQDKWLVNIPNDTLILNGQNVKFASIMITDKIDQSSYTFSIRIPISLYASAYPITYTGTYPFYFIGMLYNIDNIDFNVSFSGEKVSLKYVPSISLHSADAFYSDDNEIRYSPFLNNSSEKMEIKHYKYYVEINNILLNTEPGYVYDFNIEVMCSSGYRFFNRWFDGYSEIEIELMNAIEKIKFDALYSIYRNNFNETLGAFINPLNNTNYFKSSLGDERNTIVYYPFSITGQ